MAIKKVMVIGAGQMGAGIAQVCVGSGFDVLLHDMNEEALRKGFENIEKQLARNVEKGKLSAEAKPSIMKRLAPSSELKDAATCDLVIEAVIENMDVKAKVFRELDQYAPKHAILASNTSSLPITEIAAATDRPD